MTLRNLVRCHLRPLGFAVACSAAALALLLGASGATFAADGHDHGHYRKGKNGDDRYYQDDYRYDRGGGGYDSGRYHRDPGYRYDDRYRNDYRESYRGGYYDRGGYDRRYYDRGYGPGRFVVPHFIYRDRYRDYDRYYRGAVYYAPHHHEHRVYLFPVIVGEYLEYRPYAYCGEAYYPDQYYGYDGGYGRGYGHFGLQFGF